ncbi:MAG: hypothetical protein CME40_03115 [Haliea sp.]|nr:hypothetical protein [Haliea sp.]|tara:strand:+ start:169327 stop:169557 length:231 start_codon:yes stop_codon:yes gene_type:complete
MTTAAERMRKLRERRVAGIRVLPIEVQIDTVETLIELNYLAVEEAHDLERTAKALARFIEDAAGSVTSHAITLDAW